MKIAFIPLLLILAVLAGGCMAVSPAAPAPPASPVVSPVATAAPAIPNLTGIWTGPMQGYDEGTGFSDYPSLTVSMIVSGQHGRIFAGDFLFRENGTETRSPFAGAVGRDGRTLWITERNGGYCFGEILAADEMELTYMEDGSPYSIAVDSFR